MHFPPVGCEEFLTDFRPNTCVNRRHHSVTKRHCVLTTDIRDDPWQVIVFSFPTKKIISIHVHCTCMCIVRLWYSYHCYAALYSSYTTAHQSQAYLILHERSLGLYTCTFHNHRGGGGILCSG